MPNFKIVFMKHFENREESLDTGEFSRVIVADDLEMARKIAEAMLYEEVYVGEYLARLLSVELTDETPNIAVWDDGSYTWQRILRKMNLQGTKVEFILFSSPYGQKYGPKKVGIKFVRKAAYA